ncbi:hypothetical protein HELRODRAFT_164804 [Helobdella robusta]|uniref:Uncharacterized protein n=1 Tax=Helobdella robusta TaxID=6412 RepID=T1EVT9_HELRO|nr:hypothetical protein HELRODRAFT_164804 [Helobdella robusta]ESN92708.1 hypothetical protein HELRODRAFT_164804 [Helobdella robusta]
MTALVVYGNPRKSQLLAPHFRGKFRIQTFRYVQSDIQLFRKVCETTANAVTFLNNSTTKKVSASFWDTFDWRWVSPEQRENQEYRHIGQHDFTDLTVEDRELVLFPHGNGEPIHFATLSAIAKEVFEKPRTDKPSYVGPSGFANITEQDREYLFKKFKGILMDTILPDLEPRSKHSDESNLASSSNGN